MSYPAAVIYILRHVGHRFSQVHTHSTWSHALSQTSWQRIMLWDIRGSNSDQQVNRHWQQPVPHVNLATAQCINFQQNFPWGARSEKPLNRGEAVQARVLDELAWDRENVTFFTHDSLFKKKFKKIRVAASRSVCGLCAGLWVDHIVPRSLTKHHMSGGNACGRKYDPESSSSIKKFPAT